MSSNIKLFRQYTIPLRLLPYLTFGIIGIISILRGSEVLIFISLIPLIIFIQNIDKFNLKTILKDFYFSGFILCCFAFSYIWQMAASNWILSIPTWMTVTARLIAVFYIALFCSLSALALGWLLKKFPRKYRIYSLIALWPISEILRNYIMALISYGPHASVSPNYNLGFLSVSAAGTPLIFASRVVGFYGLGVLVVLINISIYKLARRKWIWLLGVFAVIILTFSCYKFGAANQDHQLKTAYVQINENETLENWTGWQKLPDNLDLLVLPEYSIILKNKDFEQIAAKLNSDGLGVTSVTAGNSPSGTNELIYFNYKGKVVSKQPKTYLIPTGEYLPYILQATFWVFGQQQLNDNFKQSQQITNGVHPENPISNNKFTAGTLVCSGVLSPIKYRRLTKKGADVLINVASLSFLDSRTFYHVHARNMARFHAVSNSRPFVQASRSGESYNFDSQGGLHNLNTDNDTKIISGIIRY